MSYYWDENVEAKTERSNQKNGNKTVSESTAMSDNVRGQRDIKLLGITLKVLNLETRWTKERIWNRWIKHEIKLKRKAPIMQGHWALAALQVREKRVRRVLIL